ncbi:MAG: DUF6458 family protein [Acidimicrobiia bacterium]
MGFGISLLLIAAGAVLTFAVDATLSGLDINTVGIILMIVGGVGLLASLVFWSSWGGFRSSNRTVVHNDGYPIDQGYPADREVRQTTVREDRTL